MQTEKILCLNSAGFHRMAVHVWNKEGSGVPLICVHGLTRNGRDFDRLAERLAATRPVYCPDIAGRGTSEILPHPQDYNLDQYKRDLVGLLALIGTEQVDWVGTSMGGILGMMLASFPQSPIRRLVLNDVGPIVPKDSLDRIGVYVGEKPVFETLGALEDYIRTLYAAFGVPDDAAWALMAEHSHHRTPDGRYVLAYDPQIALPFKGENAAVDLWSLYDKITAPTLLLRGGQSDMLPPALAQEMTARGPRAKLVEFAGCGHAPALMSDEQTRVIEAFLEG